MFANIDLDKTLGWSGVIFHANAYQIHGQGLTCHDLGQSGHGQQYRIRARNPAVRAVGAAIAVQRCGIDPLGQIAADDEFFVSQYAPLFINSTFGWPSIMGINLPSGGPGLSGGAAGRAGAGGDVAAAYLTGGRCSAAIPAANEPASTCT